MIIGYYGAEFFRGAKCFKAYEHEKGKTYFELVDCRIPNILRGAEEGIKDNKPITKHIDLNRCFYENCKIIRKRISDNKKTELEEYISGVDWKYLSEQKYTYNYPDCLCWQMFIEYKGEEYSIKGYHYMPKEIKTLIKYIDELE